MKKSFKYLIVIVAVLLVLTGGLFLYGRTDDTLAAGDESMQLVTDSSKRSVAIPKQPKRVLILNASNLEIFYAVGGEVIGKATSPSYPEYLKDKIRDIPEVGMIHTPNLEKIISLKPDLVIGTKIPFHTALAGPLKAAGIPLYINGIDSYQDVLKSVEFFGSLTGKPELAAAKQQEIDNNYHAALNKSKAEHGPKTLIVWGSPDSFSMATKYSFSGNMLNSVGGTNIADFDNTLKGLYVPLSMEYITQQNPEVIMVITMGEDTSGIMDKFKKELQTNMVWKDVSAVQNGRVYQLPPSLFTVNPGTQIADAAIIMANYLHSEKDKKNG